MSNRSLKDRLAGRGSYVAAAVLFLVAGLVLTLWLWPERSALAGREIVARDADGKEHRLRLNRDDASGASPMQKTLDAYFALGTKAERDAFLDKMIEAADAAQKEFGDLKLGEGGPATRPATRAARSGEGGEQPPRRRVTMSSGGRSMAESLPAETQGRLAELTRAINDRRKERGLPPGPVVIVHKPSAGK